MEYGARRVMCIASNIRELTVQCVKCLQQIDGIKVIDFEKELSKINLENCKAYDGTKTTVESGKLLDEKMTVKAMKMIMRKQENLSGFIVIVGYPCSLTQLEAIDRYFTIVNGNVIDRIIFYRINSYIDKFLDNIGMGLCKCDDDTRDKVINRFTTYLNYTSKLQMPHLLNPVDAADPKVKKTSYQKARFNNKYNVEVMTIEDAKGYHLAATKEIVEAEYENFKK